MFHELVSKSVDERSERVTGRCAAIFLGLTQVALAVVLFYRLYVLGQPDSQLRDIQGVLLLSIFGYIGARAYLGGILPVLSWRSGVIGYLVLAGLITGFCLAIYGVPEAAEWTNTWLPALLGPALLVGGYALVAHLGQRRIERQLSD